ncbi:MAG: hypothetical protein OSB58_20110 [Alphaproteobacteria bacterium]|nr:hypothetical protein [Alphaproteobacteria bacterium]
MTKSRNVHLDHDDFITSADRRLGDEPDWIRPELEWLEGVHGSAADTQAPGNDIDTPDILLAIPELHPDRPTGATAMIDAHGAKHRLKGCRPGSWLISPKTGWKWSVWPSGHVGWLPMDIELPDALRVNNRNDVQ